MMEGMPAEFAREFPSLVRQLLWARGFRSNEEAHEFLYPSLTQVPVPLGQLRDVEEAVAVLLKAHREKERVVIFGDYDVDGATSTALLVSVLKAWGFDVGYYIPHRVQEGYGVTLKAATKLAEKEPKVKVVVTCDCGVASFEGISFLKSKNIRVIVTDHHEVPNERVPADAILNPKQKNCAYPDKRLAGVGVAFLLLVALRRALDLKDFALNSYLDLVAIGTVCDVAELRGANRALVKLGLKRLSATNRMGLQVMLRNLDLGIKSIKSKDLGFLIGPRINATGRIGEPDVGVKMLLAEDRYEAEQLVNVLETHNRQRQELQKKQLEAAERQAELAVARNPDKKSLVLCDKQFHLGIVGLVAAKISEKFKRPVCVLTELIDEHALADFSGAGVLWKGSLRTPVGYHLADALDSIRSKTPDFFKSAGGHAMAAGVALEQDRVKIFEDLFENAISSQKTQTQNASAEVVLENVNELGQVLSLLEPFGQANPPPLVRVNDFQLQKTQVMKEEHLKLHGKLSEGHLSVLQFKSPWVRMFADDLKKAGDVRLDLVGELTENEWNGNKSVELHLKDLLEVRVSGKRIQTGTNQNEIGNRQGLRKKAGDSHTASLEG